MSSCHTLEEAFLRKAILVILENALRSNLSILVPFIDVLSEAVVLMTMPKCGHQIGLIADLKGLQMVLNVIHDHLRDLHGIFNAALPVEALSEVDLPRPVGAGEVEEASEEIGANTDLVGNAVRRSKGLCFVPPVVRGNLLGLIVPDTITVLFVT